MIKGDSRNGREVRNGLSPKAAINYGDTSGYKEEVAEEIDSEEDDLLEYEKTKH